MYFGLEEIDVTRKLDPNRLPYVLGVVGLLNALAGYLRELTLAAIFGVGGTTDAYFVALGIPMMVGDLLIGGAITAAIIPTLSLVSSDRGHGRDLSRAFVSIFVMIAVASTLIAGAICAFMPAFINTLAPGSTSEIKTLAVQIGRLIIWILPVNASLLAVSFALNFKGIFVLPALTPLINHLIFSVLLLISQGAFVPEALAVAVLSGPVFMLGIMLLAAFSHGRYSLCLPYFGGLHLRKAWVFSRPVVVSLGLGSGMGLLIATHMVVRAFASHLGVGSISALSYAFRIYEVPISIITSVAATLLLPVCSNLHSQGRRDELAKIIQKGAFWGLAVLAPISFVAFLNAEFLVALLFSTGRFDQGATALTTEALQGFSAAIIFESIFIVGFRVLYAMRLSKVAAFAGLASMISLLTCLNFGPDSLSLLQTALTVSFCFALAAIICVAFVFSRFSEFLFSSYSKFLRMAGLILFWAFIYGNAFGWLNWAPSSAFAHAVSIVLFLVLFIMLFALVFRRDTEEAARYTISIFKRVPND